MARKSGRVVAAPRYRARTALSYHGRRVQPGAECVDLPPQSVSWLHAAGHIERITDDETHHEKDGEAD